MTLLVCIGVKFVVIEKKVQRLKILKNKELS